MKAKQRLPFNNRILNNMFESVNNFNQNLLLKIMNIFLISSDLSLNRSTARTS